MLYIYCTCTAFVANKTSPLTRRVIGHARQRYEVDWLQFANCSSVQFSSSAVNAPLVSVTARKSIRRQLVRSGCVRY